MGYKQDYFKLLNPAGRMVIYGATAGNPPEGLDLVRLFFRQVQIRGTTMGSPEEFAAMLRLIAEQRIEPVIDHIFCLDKAIAAHKHLQAADPMGKVILRQG